MRISAKAILFLFVNDTVFYFFLDRLILEFTDDGLSILIIFPGFFQILSNFLPFITNSYHLNLSFISQLFRIPLIRYSLI